MNLTSHNLKKKWHCEYLYHLKVRDKVMIKKIVKIAKLRNVTQLAAKVVKADAPNNDDTDV